MTDTADRTASAAARLERAQADRVPCTPVRDLIPAGNLDAAYAVQSAIIDARLTAGARIVGRKIGLTNPNVQAQFGVQRPDFGVLLDDMVCTEDVPVDIDRLLQPRVEAEVAFVLKADLAGPVITEADVVAATDHIVAALEIVDSRIADWDITIVDTVADNGSSALFVLGADPVQVAGLDLTAITMTMTCGDTVVSSGTGKDCLGNPLTAVVWLAETARDYGTPLRAGDVVLSGALGPIVAVEPGAAYTAQIADVGQVSATFTERAPR